jgi:arylsulfatase A-like enzyme
MPIILFAIVVLTTSAVGAAERFNVLFFAVDDLRPELSAYGKSYIHSPNIDRIAKRGVTFNRAYCQQAVCSPSRSSLLTGTRPDETKVWDLQTHFRDALPDIVTLPQHFKENSYFVQGMGKIFHGSFDDPRSWSVPWTSPKGSHGTYGRPENQAIVKAKVEAARQAPKKEREKMKTYGPPFEASDVPDDTFHDGVLAEMAVTALGECAKQEKPFWLGVGFIRPHLPFVAPQKYWDLYDPAKIELAPNPYPPKGAPEYAAISGGELRQYYDVPKGPIPDDLARKLKHGYYASISYMDAQVGRVLDELDRLGLAEKTVIVLWGDHGWKLGEHGAWCKHTNVENDTNAPLLIAVPGLKSAGARTDALAEFVDIYPTLAEACGLPLPAHLAGNSQLPVLRDPTTKVKDAAYSQYPRSHEREQLMGYTMRTDRYRYTRWLLRGDHSQVRAVELYDHVNDPQENVNIAGDPAMRPVLDALESQWRAGPAHTGR